MFEQSLLDTSGRERRRGRWIALDSVAVQLVLLTGFVVGPLLYPATMPAYRVAEMKSVTLVEAKPKPVVVRKPVVVHEAASTAAPTIATETRQVVQASGAAVPRPAIGDAETPQLVAMGDGPGMGTSSIPGLGPSSGTGFGRSSSRSPRLLPPR